MRRVVVTGIGMCTPLGFGWKHCWNKLIEGKSGIRQLSGFEISDLPSKVGGQLPMDGDKTLFSENIIEQLFVFGPVISMHNPQYRFYWQEIYLQIQ